ncbi:class I SAM-dependent methyltransferase [Actinocrispum sp. NPDC049592]|uniref:class I SAM-dependent methyltransferase n=1 Tax=Actinocrispum sp. NPDC049592 TaxID=3154835 RepID=UPI00341240BB
MALLDSWNSHADEWVAWARTPAHDHYFRDFHWPAFVKLLPEPGRLTLDIGCGEGRLSRSLQAVGHRMIAIDGAPNMIRAVVTHEEPVTALLADSSRLPLADEVADCVIAFMSLHDIDPMPETVREIARVLSPGGHLVIAIVHPINSLGRFENDAYTARGDYFEPKHYADPVTRDGLSMTFHGIHRPLQAYTEALADAGFVITRMREVNHANPDHEWHRMPLFLHIVAAK